MHKFSRCRAKLVRRAIKSGSKIYTQTNIHVAGPFLMHTAVRGSRYQGTTILEDLMEDVIENCGRACREMYGIRAEQV